MKILSHFLLVIVLAGFSDRNKIPNLFFGKRSLSMPAVEHGNNRQSEMDWFKRAPLEEAKQQKRGYSMPFYKRGYSMPMY